ncbi:hypothetical protein PLCT1_02218 [Planctomycetaceae bacterium]|nr:hypothetical protein PLCT1_02218 [Planctomycetaceae bacterium]
MRDAETIWNLLHDGTIVGIDTVGRTLVCHIEVSYLRSFFTPPGTGFEIHLSECTFHGSEAWAGGPIEHDPHTLAALQPEILSAQALDHGVVAVTWDGGVFRLSYSGVTLRLDSGAPIPLEALKAAATTYWDRFSRNA